MDESACRLIEGPNFRAQYNTDFLIATDNSYNHDTET